MTEKSVSVLVPTQAEVQVYLDPSGDVVFTRSPTGAEEQESFIVIPRHYVKPLVKRLNELLKESSGG